MKPSTVIAISLGATAIGALAVLAFRTDPVPVDWRRCSAARCR